MNDIKQHTKFGNINHVKHFSTHLIDSSVENNIMHQTLRSRQGKHIAFGDYDNVVEFLNCSYLGLDVHPALTEGAKSLLDTWGVHMGNVRTRFSIDPHMQLEKELNDFFGAHTITFASVSCTHMSVLPLIASGMLLGEHIERPRLIFDKYAHSSMQSLKPICAQYADVHTIDNNSLTQLEDHLKEAQKTNQTTVYITDAVFSMGGLPPLADFTRLQDKYDLFLYLDDAHGTSVFGEHGEGYVIETYKTLSDKTFLIFSLAKGFGCNGGGIAFPKAEQHKWAKYYGQIYSFSSALPWGMIGAALASLELHRNGTVAQLQKKLKTNINTFCNAIGIQPKTYMSPVQGIHIGDAETAISIGKECIDNGYYVPIVFFPVVPKNHARIRVWLSALHTDADLIGLATVLKKALHSRNIPLQAI